MDKFDETLDQLKDSSGGMKPNFHILDEIIPIEEQMKYFNYSKYIHNDRIENKFDIEFLVEKLFSSDVQLEDRRYYLTLLAGIIDVAAYRAIEIYNHSPLEPELAKWSAMALIENKVLLDGELSGEQQFFVSTGLGGYKGMLRFFSVIASADRDDFNPFQIETLLKELDFAFEQNNITLETREIRSNYIKLTFLCDLQHDVRRVIDRAIIECNDLGHYVDPKFILTNLRKIEDDEIQRMLNKEKTV